MACLDGLGPCQAPGTGPKPQNPGRLLGRYRHDQRSLSGVVCRPRSPGLVATEIIRRVSFRHYELEISSLIVASARGRSW